MRFVHVTCVLLATAICCNAAAIQGDAKSTNQQAAGTVNETTLAKNSTTPVHPANASLPITNAAKTTIDNTTTVAPATTVSTNVNGNRGNVTSANEQSTASTASPPVASTTATATAAPTTLSTTTKQPPILENCTTTIATATATITTPTTSNPSVSSTTAVPVSTKVAPPFPYKEQHFDGLSFLGGIILATCLMAIGALSWKFYKTLNERQYRTL